MSRFSFPPQSSTSSPCSLGSSPYPFASTTPSFSLNTSTTYPLSFSFNTAPSSFSSPFASFNSTSSASPSPFGASTSPALGFGLSAFTNSETTTPSPFGAASFTGNSTSSASPSPFGASSSVGSTSGATTTPSPFGAASSTGNSTSSASPSPFGASSSVAFGSTSGATTTPSPFGAASFTGNSTSSASPSPFGASSSSAFGFGSSASTAGVTTTPSLFGAASSTGSSTSSASPAPFGASSSAASTTTSPFGASSSAASTTTSPFGAAFSVSSSASPLCGAASSAASTTFPSFGISSSAATTTANLFGSSSFVASPFGAASSVPSATPSPLGTSSSTASSAPSLFGAATGASNLFGFASTSASTLAASSTTASVASTPALPSFSVSSSAATTTASTTAPSGSTASTTNSFSDFAAACAATSSGTTSSFTGFSLASKTTSPASSSQAQSAAVAPAFAAATRVAPEEEITALVDTQGQEVGDHVYDPADSPLPKMSIEEMREKFSQSDPFKTGHKSGLASAAPSEFQRHVEIAVEDRYRRVGLPKLLSVPLGVPSKSKRGFRFSDQKKKQQKEGSAEPSVPSVVADSGLGAVGNDVPLGQAEQSPTPENVRARERIGVALREEVPGSPTPAQDSVGAGFAQPTAACSGVATSGEVPSASAGAYMDEPWRLTFRRLDGSFVTPGTLLHKDPFACATVHNSLRINADSQKITYTRDPDALEAKFSTAMIKFLQDMTECNNVRNLLLNEAEEKLEITFKRVTELESELKTAQASLMNLAALEATKAALAAKDERLKEVVARIRELEGVIVDANSRASEADAAKNALELQLAEANAQIEEANKQLEQIKTQMSDLEDEATHYRIVSENRASEAAIEIKLREAALKRAREEKETLAATIREFELFRDETAKDSAAMQDVYLMASRAHMAVNYRKGWRAGRTHKGWTPRAYDEVCGKSRGWSFQHIDEDVAYINHIDEVEGVNSDEDLDVVGLDDFEGEEPGEDIASCDDKSP